MFTPVSPEAVDLSRKPFADSEVRFNLFHKILKGKEVIALQWAEGDAVKAIAMCNPGFPMWFWIDEALEPAEKERAVASLCEAVKENKITGIAAAPEVARKFVEKYTELTGAGYELAMGLQSFHCPEVIAPRPVSGGTIPADMRHLDTIAEFYAGFIYWGFGKTVTAESQLGTAERLIKSGDLFLWETDDKVVCMTFISDRAARHARINSVYTPPELRGNGYASALVAAVSQKVLDEGRTPILFTDLSNPISNRVYKNIGYKECGKIDEFKFKY